MRPEALIPSGALPRWLLDSVADRHFWTLRPPSEIRGWTFGVEHEWADWPTSRPLPPGFGRDRKERTIVNSSGVACDPRDELHDLGGEITTPPTETIEEQVELLGVLRARYPEATVNYRSCLHVHVRIPGLRENLEALKRISVYTHRELPPALPFLAPFERPVRRGPGDEAGEEYSLALRAFDHLLRLRRRLLSETTLDRQLAATTVDEFFDAEAPKAEDGRPLHHLQPRTAVNLRQLRDTDTVEFRHYAGTLDPDELDAALRWARGYLVAAILGAPFAVLYRPARARARMPTPAPIDPWLEARYRRTARGGAVATADLPAAIAAVLAEGRNADG